MSVLCAGAATAPPNDTVSYDRIAALRADLKRAIGARSRQERYGVLALSLQNGDTLYSHGAYEALAPASNLKLLTTAAALRYLGPEYRYRTYLLTSGSIEAGRLQGDLILYGTGDPGLSDLSPGDGAAPFEEFADSLAAAGVRVVEGDVVGDGSLFTGLLRAEGWDPEDLNDWFTAAASSLSFAENVVTLRLVPTGLGNPPNVITRPEGAGIPLRFLIPAGRAGQRFLIHRTDRRNRSPSTARSPGDGPIRGDRSRFPIPPATRQACFGTSWRAVGFRCWERCAPSPTRPLP